MGEVENPDALGNRHKISSVKQANSPALRDCKLA